MKKIFLSEPLLSNEYNFTMKKDTLIAGTGILFSASIFLLFRDELKDTSPLMLILISASGFLFSFRYLLAASVILFLTGLSLVVHPFLFDTTKWFLPGGVLISFAGLSMFIKWWKSSST